MKRKLIGVCALILAGCGTVAPNPSSVPQGDTPASSSPQSPSPPAPKKAQEPQREAPGPCGTMPAKSELSESSRAAIDQACVGADRSRCFEAIRAETQAVGKNAIRSEILLKLYQEALERKDKTPS